jgi:hypothetical protein
MSLNKTPWDQRSFGLRTFRVTNDLQERIKFVNRGSTLFLTELIFTARTFKQRRPVLGRLLKSNMFYGQYNVYFVIF